MDISNIMEALQWAQRNQPERLEGLVADALAEARSIESALSTARAEGRKEGFERALELAAAYGYSFVETLHRHGLRPIMSDADALAMGIRSMRDGVGAKTPETEERVSNLCDCTGCPHRREEDCP